MNIAIIFAGGVGQRLSEFSDNVPKQFLEVNGKPILIHTLLHFEKHPDIDKIYIAMKEEFIDYTNDLIEKYNLKKVCKIIKGGKNAMNSIYNALDVAYKENPLNSVVLIHDGVRPIINADIINQNIESVKKFGSAITAIPCYETILISKDSKTPTDVPIRRETFTAQAPQSFVLEEIYNLHKKQRQMDDNYTDIVDSCTLFQKFNIQTHLTQGIFGNIKVTTPSDMYILEGILKYQEAIDAKTI